MLLEAIATLPIPKPTSPGICHLLKKRFGIPTSSFIDKSPSDNMLFNKKKSQGECVLTMGNNLGACDSSHMSLVESYIEELQPSV